MCKRVHPENHGDSRRVACRAQFYLFVFSLALLMGAVKNSRAAGNSDNQPHDGERNGGNRLLVPGHRHQLAYQLRSNRITRRPHGQHFHRRDFGDADGCGHLLRDAEGDQ